MKTLPSQGLPEITTGMRLEWRVRDAPTAEKPNCRGHSHCLVAADGTEIATIAKEAVADVRGCLRRSKSSNAN